VALGALVGEALARLWRMAGRERLPKPAAVAKHSRRESRWIKREMLAGRNMLESGGTNGGWLFEAGRFRTQLSQHVGGVDATIDYIHA